MARHRKTRRGPKTHLHFAQIRRVFPPKKSSSQASSLLLKWPSIAIKIREETKMFYLRELLKFAVLFGCSLADSRAVIYWLLGCWTRAVCDFCLPSPPVPPAVSSYSSSNCFPNFNPQTPAFFFSPFKQPPQQVITWITSFFFLFKSILSFILIYIFLFV